MKMKAVLLTMGSFLLTAGVISNAYIQKKQFYPSVVFITKSSPSMAVLYIQAFVFVVLMWKLMRKMFFGQLRAAEMEHLIERSWYAVTETCLAFTVFRDDFSPRFVALFTLLLFIKCFHWLGEDRVDYMERSPVISFLFHLRVISLLLVLGLVDAYFINHAYYSTLIKGASVQLVFGFEYAILLTVVIHILVKYILHSIDLGSDNPWDNKAVYLLYTELVLGLSKVILYMLFLAIMIKVHTFPLFAIRPMYLTMRTFKKAFNDVIMSRRAIRNMNTLYPDATAEELATGDNVCIICREEMTAPGCKKLPCNHIFHSACLRSWFQRQQTCPTCRMDVLRQTPQIPATPVAPAAAPAAAAQAQQAPAAPAQVPGNMFGFPPMFPPAAGAMPPTSTPAAPTTGAATSAPGSFAGYPQMPPMMPPFAMPFMSPMPVPDLNSLSREDLDAMEGNERANVLARIQWLKDIQSLLDAAVLQMNQYTTVMSSSSVVPPHPPAAAPVSRAETTTTSSASSPEPSSSAATTTTTASSSAAATTVTASATLSATATATTATATATTATTTASTTAAEPTTIEAVSDDSLEGAVGGASPQPRQEDEDDDNEELREIRRRRLERFSSETNNQPQGLDLD